jgi:sn-glycerol 3-phosphate transport system ATP-binding protein
MNLLDGEADGARFVVGGQVLALPAAAPRNGPLTLGVRPEHIELAPAGAPGGWALQVEVLEMLGAERLVYGHVGGAVFTLRLEGTLPPPKAGSTVALQVSPQHVHWFERTSGTRVG